MQNVIAVVENNKLHLIVDLAKNFGPSSSGKTTIIGTSQGNKPVEGHPGVAFGLNVYRR